MVLRISFTKILSASELFSNRFIHLIPDFLQARSKELVVALSDYNNYTRHYHNFMHIKEMLAEYEKLKDQINHKNEFILAILFHDVVYNVFKDNNEEMSACVAEEFIKNNELEEFVDVGKVKKLVRITAQHGCKIEDLNEEQKLFLDIDMFILSASQARLVEYEEGVGKEYLLRYPRELYIKGRKTFLNSLLNLKNIYFSKYYQQKHEQKAKSNIKLLISYLNQF